MAAREDEVEGVAKESDEGESAFDFDELISVRADRRSMVGLPVEQVVDGEIYQ